MVRIGHKTICLVDQWQTILFSATRGPERSISIFYIVTQHCCTPRRLKQTLCVKSSHSFLYTPFVPCFQMNEVWWVRGVICYKHNNPFPVVTGRGGAQTAERQALRLWIVSYTWQVIMAFPFLLIMQWRGSLANAALLKLWLRWNKQHRLPVLI